MRCAKYQLNQMMSGQNFMLNIRSLFITYIKSTEMTIYYIRINVVMSTNERTKNKIKIKMSHSGKSNLDDYNHTEIINPIHTFKKVQHDEFVFRCCSCCKITLLINTVHLSAILFFFKRRKKRRKKGTYRLVTRCFENVWYLNINNTRRTQFCAIYHQRVVGVLFC